MDGFGSTDSSVGEEEGSDGGEDGVGDSDGGVDRQVKHQVGARVVGGREGLHGGGRGGPGREGFQFSTKMKKSCVLSWLGFNSCSVFKASVTGEPTLTLQVRKAAGEES